MSDIQMQGEIVDLLARAEIAGIKEDVRAVSRDLHSMRDTTATKTDIQNLMSNLTALSSKHDLLRTPQYSLIVSIVGLGMIVLTTMGAFAYWPIRGEQADLKETIKTLAAGVVYSRRFDAQVGTIERNVDDIRRTYIGTREFDRLLKLFDGHVDDSMSRAEINAIIADRDARIGGTVRRLERLEEQQIKR